MGHADATGDLSWDYAVFKQVGCSQPTLLNGLMITLTDTRLLVNLRAQCFTGTSRVMRQFRTKPLVSG